MVVVKAVSRVQPTEAFFGHSLPLKMQGVGEEFAPSVLICYHFRLPDSNGLKRRASAMHEGPSLHFWTQGSKVRLESPWLREVLLFRRSLIRWRIWEEDGGQSLFLLWTGNAQRGLYIALLQGTREFKKETIKDNLHKVVTVLANRNCYLSTSVYT